MKPEEIMAALALPFNTAEIKFRPATVSGNRALALHYVDARVVMDRLDDVLGAAGWQDEYEFLPDGCAVCRLRIKIGDEWVMKMDVGGQSEQSDEGDRRKSAISDALKRAAVKFGIGRYLYRLPSQWLDYDPQKKRFVNTPRLQVERPRPASPAKAPQTAPEPEKPSEQTKTRDKALAALDDASAKGMDAVREVFAALPNPVRALVQPWMAKFKAHAKGVDDAAVSA